MTILRRFSPLRLMLLGIMLCAGASAGERHPDSGLYALWYDRNHHILDVPYLTGGQIVVQWQDLEPQPGVYDFSAIANRLKLFKEKGRRTTIQINGNRKPQWLYKQVPYYPEKVSVQISDPQGTLMYWHPIHQDAFKNLLINFSRFLAGFEGRDALIGIRLNFNAIGTEHFHISKDAQSPDDWVVPKGAKLGAAWSDSVIADYQDSIVDTYVEYLSPLTLVFLRNNIHADLEKRYRHLISSGKLGWFHTSSEKEPKAQFHENQYRKFYEDARPGHTLAYAEPWASAWGDHGIKTDNRVSSPPQWNYWRLLLDLHTGVSFIGLYYHDIEVAASGVYPRYNQNYYNEEVDGLGYQRQFEQAFLFTNKYAGYHHAPKVSPGAWVAFRENSHSLANNVEDQSSRHLTVFTGDYNFLMERLPDETTGAFGVGPWTQREGAFARVLPAGKAMRLVPNAEFWRSLNGGRVKVTFFDGERRGASFAVKCGGRSKTVTLGGSGSWRTVELPLTADHSAGSAESGEVTLTAGADPIHFHMVEITRE